MEKQLFQEIKKTNNELLKLFDIFEKQQKDLDKSSDSYNESRLHVIHDFINTSFIVILACIDRFIKFKIPSINIGYSVNYYPLYTYGSLRGRIELDGLKSFIFINNILSEIFNKNLNGNEHTHLTILNLLKEKHLNKKHIYITLLNIFYDLLDLIKNQKDEDPKTQDIFSIKNYFEVLNDEDNQEIIFENLLQYRETVSKYKNHNENVNKSYNYEDYENFLKICFKKNSDLISTKNYDYWNSTIDEDEIKSWLDEKNLQYKDLRYYQYNISANDRFEKKSRGNVVIYCDQKLSEHDDILNKGKFLCDYFITTLAELESRYLSEKQKNDIYRSNLKSAIIAILIDSYAHNISAHSLAALKWWIELRYKMMDKRIKVGVNEAEIQCLQPQVILSGKRILEINKNGSINLDQNQQPIFKDDDPIWSTTQKYYEALGLTDSTYNAQYYSLFDFLQFADVEKVKNLFTFVGKVHQKDGKDFSPRFPVPIDYALFSFFRFLRDKGAFWSGVTRDMAFGGESKTWYKILWEDFANNPLYLGTIAKSEGITKININLEVKQKGNTHLKGRFVTIDMSIIDYEEKLSQNPTLDPDEELLKNTVKNDDCKYDKDCAVSYDKYSKYAFVKLGKCFKAFRELLDNEEKYRVFLPGGIVGEHALFTIFENTIRNIKHYKEDENVLASIKKNGIDFWISIDEAKLKIDPKKDSENKPEFSDKKTQKTEQFKGEKKTELFKVGVWLEHTTPLIKVEKDNENKDVFRYKLFDITETSIEPILNEFTGSSRMGGNSQDKACAAMLFNNNFSSVEQKEKARNKEYFPWIRFATDNGDEFELIRKKDTTNEDLAVIEKEYSTKYLCKGKTGFLKKYFYLWRGEDVLSEDVLTNDDWENPSRTKFLTTKFSYENILKARQLGIIRLINANDKELLNLYYLWLSKWIINFNNYSIAFCDNTNPRLYLSIKNSSANEKIIFSQPEKKENESKISKNLKYLYLVHGSEHSYNCNVRSHGIFMTRFFNDLPNHDIDCFGSYANTVYDKLTDIVEKAKKNILLLEFWETILTKVAIFDDRVFNRIPASFNNVKDIISHQNGGIGTSKVDMLKEQLQLEIKAEIVDKFDEWLKNTGHVNFLVIHLSFIERMKDKTGKQYSENRINDFIKDKLSKLYFDDEKNIKNNFIFVITSGRGRDLWRKSLKDEDRFREFTIFKPVESILSAVENGISYNDHFDIKYNILKVLFGN